MAVKFNPFTGQLQIDEKGSGGGSSYIDGEVAAYGDLSLDAGVAPLNSAWLVREASGTWLLGRKPAGIYIRTATGGSSRDADYTYAGILPDVFSDANFTLYDDADSTKNAKFDVSAIATATTRTLTVPNASGTIQLTGHAAAHASAGSDPLFDQDLNTTDAVEFSTVVVTATLDASAASNTFLAPINTSIALVDTASTFTGTLRTDNDSLTANRTYDLPDASGVLALTSDIPALGTGAGEAAEGNHVHGNLTSDGKLGSTAGLPVVTTTAGAVTTLALGTAGQVLTVNSGANGVEFAAVSGGVTGAASSASDVLGVSGANITGVDAGSADRLVFWDDSANKLTYLEAGSGLSISGTTLTATGGGVTAVGASTADVLSVSGSDLVADDGGTIDSSDPFIKWDDAAGKLVYANPLSRPSGAMYVGLAPSTTALGSNAINIQSTRTGATNVASGSSAICIGAGGNTASGQDSISIGVGNAVSALRATAVGYANTASGQESVSLGSLGLASGVKSVGVNETAVLRGQVSLLPFRAVYWGGQTTNNTATVLNLDATATNRMTIAANTALAVDILLVARRSDTADKWLVARRFLGIRRDGSNNTSLIGSVQTLGTDQSEGSPTWTFALTADDTNEALQLEVTGAASETVQWRATAFYRFV